MGSLSRLLLFFVIVLALFVVPIALCARAAWREAKKGNLDRYCNLTPEQKLQKYVMMPLPAALYCAVHHRWTMVLVLVAVSGTFWLLARKSLSA